MIYAVLAGAWQNMNGHRIARRHKRRLRRALRGTRDSVEISTEAVYRFAAREYDPHRITLAEVESLADLLFESGAIQREDRVALRQSVKDLRDGAKIQRSGDHPRDLIHSLERATADKHGKTAHDARVTRTLAVLRLIDSRRRDLPYPPKH
jgi:hypothetical protein